MDRFKGEDDDIAAERARIRSSAVQSYSALGEESVDTGVGYGAGCVWTMLLNPRGGLSRCGVWGERQA